MTVEFRVYNSEVCKTNSGVQRYEMVVKSIEKAIGFKEVVMTIEILMEFVVKKLT